MTGTRDAPGSLMLRTIVVATDFSEQARSATDYAMELARKVDARVSRGERLPGTDPQLPELASRIHRRGGAGRRRGAAASSTTSFWATATRAWRWRACCAAERRSTASSRSRRAERRPDCRRHARAKGHLAGRARQRRRERRAQRAVRSSDDPLMPRAASAHQVGAVAGRIWTLAPARAELGRRRLPRDPPHDVDRRHHTGELALPHRRPALVHPLLVISWRLP